MSKQPTILMTDPAHYGVSYEINPWMQPDVWRREPLRGLTAARTQWRALKASLQAEGALIEVMEGKPGLPDMVFPANAAIVLNRRALMARFRHPERSGEEAPFRAAFESLRRRGLIDEVSVNATTFQEGAGDCIWDKQRSLFWVGSGPRSDPSSSGLIADHFGEETVSLPLATERYYHLDTCFCPLSGGEVLYYPPALTSAGLRRLRDRVAPELLIEAGQEDAERFCVNAVCLGRSLVMSSPSERLARRLVEHGYDVVGLDVSPFILAGGGAFCMTLRLDLASARGGERSPTRARKLQEVAS